MVFFISFDRLGNLTERRKQLSGSGRAHWDSQQSRPKSHLCFETRPVWHPDLVRNHLLIGFIQTMFSSVGTKANINALAMFSIAS